jgi:thioredoxin reductase
MTKVDVIVVGAGPTGLTLALQAQFSYSYGHPTSSRK